MYKRVSNFWRLGDATTFCRACSRAATSRKVLLLTPRMSPSESQDLPEIPHKKISVRQDLRIRGTSNRNEDTEETSQGSTTPPAAAASYAKNKLFKEKEVKEKAVRKDVQERALTNANSTFTVVKTTWKALGRRAIRLLDLEAALLEVNKTIAEAYLLANVHVAGLCTAGIPLCKLDQTFFHRCLSAVSVSQKRKPETKDFQLLVSARLYRSWRPEGYVPPVSTHLACGFHQQASQQMAYTGSLGNVLTPIDSSAWARSTFH